MIWAGTRMNAFYERFELHPDNGSFLGLVLAPTVPFQGVGARTTPIPGPTGKVFRDFDHVLPAVHSEYELDFLPGASFA